MINFGVVNPRIREMPCGYNPLDRGLPDTKIMEDRLYSGKDYITIGAEYIADIKKVLRFNDPWFLVITMRQSKTFWVERSVVIGYIRCWRITGL